MAVETPRVQGGRSLGNHQVQRMILLMVQKSSVHQLICSKYPIICRVSVTCQVVYTGLVDPSTVGVGCTPAPKNHHGFFCSKTMSLVENINRCCSFLGMVQSQKCSPQSCNKIIWGLRIESPIPTCYVHDLFVNKMGCQLHFCWVFQRVESRHGVSSDLVFQARGPSGWDCSWLPWSILTKNFTQIKMDVSENRGTPKSSILKGFSIINHPFWGTPIFGNTQMFWKKRLVYSRWWQLKYFLKFSPRSLREMIQIWRAYVSNGLVKKPPTSWC